MPVIRKILPTELPQYRAHLLRLDRADRYARFTGTLSDEAVERHCAAKAAQIRPMQPVRLTSEMQRQKIELIHKILANDAEIRNFTEPWMKRLWTLLGSSRMARQVGKAYDSSAFE